MRLQLAVACALLGFATVANAATVTSYDFDGTLNDEFIVFVDDPSIIHDQSGGQLNIHTSDRRPLSDGVEILMESNFKPTASQNWKASVDVFLPEVYEATITVPQGETSSIINLGILAGFGLDSNNFDPDSNSLDIAVGDLSIERFAGQAPTRQATGNIKSTDAFAATSAESLTLMLQYNAANKELTISYDNVELVSEAIGDWNMGDDDEFQIGLFASTSGLPVFSSAPMFFDNFVGEAGISIASTIPEPVAGLLMMLGLVGVGQIRRR